MCGPTFSSLSPNLPVLSVVTLWLSLTDEILHINPPPEGKYLMSFTALMSGGKQRVTDAHRGLSSLHTVQVVIYLVGL